MHYPTLSHSHLRKFMVVVCLLVACYTAILTTFLAAPPKYQTPTQWTSLHRRPLHKNRKLQVLISGQPLPQPPALQHQRVYQINLTEPTVKPLPDQVSWIEDLSHGSRVCNGTEEEPPLLLAIVPSAVQNFQARNRVRRTWANATYYNYTKLHTVFVLGSTVNQTLQQQVRREMDLHHDIIQNTFIDSYRNLTYKTISWLSWVKDRCPETPYIAKVDEDVVVNPFNLYSILKLRYQSDPKLNSILGRVRKNAKPHRTGRWQMTEEEYPGPVYPRFILGSAYILGRNTVGPLLQHARHIPYLWLEDVYTTGIVAEAAGVKRIQVERTLFSRKITHRLFKNVAFLVDANQTRMDRAWLEIMRHSECCRGQWV